MLGIQILLALRNLSVPDDEKIVIGVVVGLAVAEFCVRPHFHRDAIVFGGARAKLES